MLTNYSNIEIVVINTMHILKIHSILFPFIMFESIWLWFSFSSDFRFALGPNLFVFSFYFCFNVNITRLIFSSIPLTFISSSTSTLRLVVFFYQFHRVIIISKQLHFTSFNKLQAFFKQFIHTLVWHRLHFQFTSDVLIRAVVSINRNQATFC